MKWQLAFGLLLLLAMVAFAGCYTQVGYPEHSLHTHVESRSSDFNRKYRRVLEEEKTEDVSEAKSEELESEDAEKSEGYYGRRKYTRRTTYAHPYRYDTYWMPYMPYPYGYYLPVARYYPHPWFYGYRYYGYAPYYRYYRGYYPHSRYYGRYHRSGSRYVPLSRRTYKRGNLRLENRRSRSSRSVTSPKSRSERPLRRTRDQNEK